VRESIVSITSMKLTKRTTFFFMMIFSTIIVLDSAIVRYSSFSGTGFSVALNIVIFVTFFTLFSLASILLIHAVNKQVSRYAYEQLPRLRYFHYIISVTLYFICSIMLVIILQLIFLNEYSVSMLRLQTYVSHLSAAVFLMYLIFLFIRWSTLKRNYVVILYSLSLSILLLNLIISLIYLDFHFTTSIRVSTVGPLPINIFVSNIPGSAFTESLAAVFDAMSLLSFSLMWIATGMLLSQYRYRMGRIKYLSVICVPFVYYIFPFQGYFGDVLFPFLISSPLIFSTFYILIFSATRQVGSILFGLAFWFTSGLIYNDRIRRSLLVSAIGITVLFSSIILTPLKYAVYPPYGLITEAFIPLGAYLLLIGIFTSAIHISRDAMVRRELYKSAVSQLDLLRNIGTSEMEKALQTKVSDLQQKFNPLSSSPDLERNLDEPEVKKILHDVLNELYYSKKEPERGS
jgi:hypothetical protein